MGSLRIFMTAAVLRLAPVFFAVLPVPALAASIQIPAVYPAPIWSATDIQTDPNLSFVRGTHCPVGGPCVPVIVSQQVGQRFSTPAGNYNLTSFSMAARPANSGVTPPATYFTLALYEWSIALGAPVGAPLYISPHIDVPGSQGALIDANFGLYDYTVAMDVPLLGSSEYLLQFIGDGRVTIGYYFGADSNMVLQEYSSISFANESWLAIPPVILASQLELTAIPEPSTWLVMLSGLLTLAFGARTARRPRSPAPR